MTTLTTPRLILRPPADTDRNALVAALGNLDVSRWTGRIPHPYGAEDADTFIEHVRASPADALILLIEREDTVIGGIGIEWGELGYWIAEPYWGKGFATEAAQAIVGHAFREMNRDDVTASYIIGNGASQRILEGLGFAETGTGTAFSKARQEEVALVRLVLKRAAWERAEERRR
jgi:RimJ/RimL family protein N-acetyltransferase